MDSPRIALRFRDAIPGIDTISEHRAIIAREGATWWGWWKKHFEPNYADFLDELGLAQGRAILLDRASRQAFVARFLRVLRCGQGEPDETRIPPYYREFADQVAAWFLITEIQDIEYREDIGHRLGETTLLVLDTAEGLQTTAKSRLDWVSANDRDVVLHLSDLHFGADYAFLAPGIRPSIGDPRQSLTKCVVEDLKRIGLDNSVGAILITGDFTTKGDWSDSTQQQILEELSLLAQAVGVTQEHIVAVPGNHDIVRYPPGMSLDLTQATVDKQTSYKHERDFRLFLEQLTGRRWNEPLNRMVLYRLKDIDLQVCILNSCTIVATQWTEYGYVGPAGIDALQALEDISISRPTFRLMALHHHLVPINRVDAPNEQGVSLTLDAVEILDVADRCGVQLAVHGHQHLPRIMQYRNFPLSGGIAHSGMFIVCVGSAGAIEARRPGAERNSYSAFRFQPNGVRLWLRELRTDAKAGAAIFDGDLPINPLEPAGL